MATAAALAVQIGIGLFRTCLTNGRGRAGRDWRAASRGSHGPVDLEARVFPTNISLDDATCNLNLALSVAEYFGLKSAGALEIVAQVASVVRTWTPVAERNGARPAEIKRMASAFEHEDLANALAL